MNAEWRRIYIYILKLLKIIQIIVWIRMRLHTKFKNEILSLFMTMLNCIPTIKHLLIKRYFNRDITATLDLI